MARGSVYCRGRAVPVGNVEVVESSVERLYPRHGNLCFLGQLQWGAEVCLNLHRTPGLVVEPHGAVSLLGLCHFLNGGFPDVGGECAVLGGGKSEQLVEHAVDEGAHANLVHQLGVFWGLENDTGGVEGNWTVAS